MMALPVVFKGAPGSPYTRKMMAVLRYRRIPYRYLLGSAADKAGMPKPKVELLPTFYLPDAQGVLEAVTDSTPLIRRFEKDVAGRNVIPPDPVLALIDAVLEDFADEWVTKAMFHYRWVFADAIAKAGAVLPVHFVGITASPGVLDTAQTQFAQRQIARLAVVGSNAQTAAIIESGYERLVDLLDAHLQTQAFLMGQRPGASDFALYGQLTQLAHFDPVSAALTLERSRRVFAWVEMLEDLSGLEPMEGDWAGADALSPTLLALLSELSQGYLPVLLANARALAQAEKQMSVDLPSGRWQQAVVPYQAKCLRCLREQFAALDEKAQARAQAIFEATGLTDLIYASV